MKLDERCGVKGKVYRFLDWIQDRTDINVAYYLSNSFWVGLSHFLILILGTGVTVAFTRLATKAVYGQYNLLIAILGTLSIVSVPGILQSIVRSVAKGFEGVYRKGIRKRMYYGAIGVPLLVLLGLWYHNKNQTDMAMCFFIAAFFFPVFNVCAAWKEFLKAKQEFRLLSEYSVITASIHTAALIAVIHFSNGNLVVIFLGYMLSFVLSNLFFLFRSFQLVSNEEEDENWLDYGLFLTKTNVLATLIGNLDKIIVGLYLGIEELAVYSLGVKFGLSIQRFLHSLLTTTTPRIAKMNTVSMRTYGYVFISSLVPTIVLILVAPFIITTLFTAKYSESIVLSQIIIAFLPFYIINNIYSKHFTYFLGNRNILLMVSILSPLTFLGLMVVLISRYGVVGLALARGIRSVFYILILFILSRVFSDVRDEDIEIPEAGEDAHL